MGFIVFIAIIIMVFLINQFVQKKEAETIQIIKKAQVECDLENYYRAKSLYERAIKRDKKNPYLFYEYAEVFMAIKQYKEAIFSYSNAIALKPDYDSSYLRRAFAYIQTRNYKKALEDCNQVINTNNLDSVPLGAYIMRGTVFIYLGKYEKALGEFNLALNLNPDFFLVHTCRAEVYCYLDKYDKALESVRKSLEMDTTDLDINYLWRGWANYGLSNFKEALEDCSYYIEKDKESPKAFEVRGLIYKAYNKLDDALADLEHAASLYRKQRLPGLYSDKVSEHIKEIQEKKSSQ